MKTTQVTFRKLNPEGSKMWAYDLNGELTPDNVSGYSETEAYFRCTQNPKHIFQRKIKKMTSHRDGHNVGCKYCGPNAKVAFPGENDLFSICKEAVEMWDYEQNIGLDPTSLLPASAIRAYFKCPKGHIEHRKISDFTKSPKCQACEKMRTKLIFHRPLTHLFWNYAINTKIDLDSIIKSARDSASFICPNCSYSWDWAIKTWAKYGYCPRCGFDGTEGSTERNKELISKNPILTFREANPEAAMMWDYEANDTITPDNIFKGQDYIAHFICLKGHKFEQHISSVSTICPHCNTKHMKAYKGESDLFTLCPPAKEMWDYTLNEGIDPAKLTTNSGIEIHFKCKRGHTFRRKVQTFTKSPKCHQCDIIDNRSIAAKRPDMMEFWDEIRNHISASEITPSSSDSAFWKCKKCGYQWQQSIRSRSTANKGKCPSCDLGRVVNEGQIIANSFLEANPEASKLWIPEMNNGIEPHNTTAKSGKFVYMRCQQNPLHTYQRKICEIPSTPPYLCPDCNKMENSIIPSVNDLFTVCEPAKIMWDYNKNTGYDTSKISPKSTDKVFWICSKGHSFERRINSFVITQRCKDCDTINKSIAKYSHMVKFWNFKKNKGIDINLTSSDDKTTVWWKCKECGYEWQAQIASRKFSKGTCPCCETRIIVAKGITDLFSLVPEIMDTYDYAENTGIDVNKLSVSSTDPVSWRCQDCGYKWKASPSSRVRYIDKKYVAKSCPSCTGQVRTITYAEEFPDLAERFVEELNQCTLASLSSRDLNNDFWWKCNICKECFESTLRSMIRSRSSSSKGCSYCSGKKVVREKSFAALHPEVMDEYDPSNVIDPFSVTEHSSLPANWICRNNSAHKWSAPFSQRAKGQGKCDICHEYNYEKMLYQEHPEFEDFFDTSRNVRSFRSYSNMSNQYVYWKCSKGHSFEWSIMGMSQKNRFSCPYCENRRLSKGENDLASQYPDLANEFNSTKNGILPDDILVSNSAEDTWWTCENGHEFQRSVWYRVKYTRECPVCSRLLIIKGQNDFQTKYQKIQYIWDYNKNSIKPDEISDKHNGKYHFICRSGHNYQAYLDTMISNNFMCLVCMDKIIQVGTNSLVDTDPILATEFSPNELRHPNEFHKSSSYEALWLCPTCNNEYRYPIRERELGDTSCPYCSNRRVSAGFNSLDVTRKELIPEWSPNNIRSMNEFLAFSIYYALWICPTCNGEYPARICDREVGDDSCPYCSHKRKLAGFNTLEVTRKELIPEWSPNNIRSMNEFLASSSYHALWICPTCNGEYPARIRDREVGDDSCPFCSNKRALSGFNSLEVTRKELIPEWSPNNIRSMNEFLASATYQALWICPTCNGEYQARICDREIGDDSCPYCTNKRKLAGFNTLEVTKKELIPEWSPNNLRSMDDFFDTSTYAALWICPTCNGEYTARIRDREVGDDSCPFCSNKRALSGFNSLDVTRKELIPEWSPNNLRSMNEFLASAKYQALWICPTCNGEYPARICDREVGDDSCPYCKFIWALPGYNTFKVRHSDLMEEWDYQNNYLLCDADKILDSYSRDVWWLCKTCGHHYPTSPKRRVYHKKRHMQSCLYCKGLRRKKNYIL